MARKKESLPGWKKTLLLHVENIKINNDLSNTATPTDRRGYDKNIDDLLASIREMAKDKQEEVENEAAALTAARALDAKADKAKRETKRIKDTTNSLNAATKVVKDLAALATGFGAIL